MLKRLIVVCLLVACWPLLAQDKGFKRVSTLTAAEGQNKWALVVGINRYLDDGITDLRFAVNDADKLYQLLVDPEYGGFDAKRVSLLTDKTPTKPTRVDVLLSLKLLQDSADDDDTIFIFFSGHGMAEGNQSYFLTRDTRLALIVDTAVPKSAFERTLSQTQAKVQVMFFDACHSGASKDKDADGTMSQDLADFIDQQTEGRVILSSCGLNEVAYEDEQSGHGIFTRYLLEALKGNADQDADGMVSVSEASTYTTEAVRTWAFQQRKKQNPRLSANVSGEILLTVNREGEQLAQLSAKRSQLEQQLAEIKQQLEQAQQPDNVLSQAEQLEADLQQKFQAQQREPIDVDQLFQKAIEIQSKMDQVHTDVLVEYGESKRFTSQFVTEHKARSQGHLDDLSLLNRDLVFDGTVVSLDLGPYDPAGQVFKRAVLSIASKQHSKKDPDITIGRGAPIIAMSNGFINQTGNDPKGFGRYIGMRPLGFNPDSEDVEMIYGHLLRFAQGVKRGKTVDRGEIIGYVGSTRSQLEPFPWISMIAKEDGIISEVGSNHKALGRYIRIKYAGKDTETLYSNLTQFANWVKQGINVSRGEVIGYFGLTSNEVEPFSWRLKAPLTQAKQFKQSVENGTVKIRAKVKINAITQKAAIVSAVVKDLVQGQIYKTPVMVMVTSRPNEGKVLVDGRFEGYTPLKVGLPIGSNRVEVKFQRFDLGDKWQKYKTVEVKEGASYRVNFDFGTYILPPIDNDTTNMVLIPRGPSIWPFYMDKYEVTNAQYRKFVQATGHRQPMYWDDDRYNQPNQPVVGVDWYDATAYAKWAGKQLPTEAEWEWAARGGLKGKTYPWGNREPNSSQANYDENVGRPTPVSSYPANEYGLYNMAGNVSEWCQDWSNSDRDTKVVRGGGWSSSSNHLRVAYQYLVGHPNKRNSASYGFRCKRKIPAVG